MNKLLLKYLLLTLFTTSSLCQVSFKILHPEILKNLRPDGIETKVLMWGKQSTMQDTEAEIVMADPSDGCEEYQNTQNQGQELYFVKGDGKCSIGTLIHNAQAAGGVGLMIQHNTDNFDDIVPPDHISGKK